MASSPSSAVTGSRPSMRSSIRQPPSSDSPRVPRRRDATDPAAVLHVDRQVQAKPLFDGRAVDLAAHECRATGHDVDDVAGDEADGQEHQHAQDEQGGDDQQQPPDDVGSHIFVVILAPGSSRLPAPCSASRTSAKNARGTPPLGVAPARGVAQRLPFQSPNAGQWIDSEPHFSLQILVDPEAGEDGMIGAGLPASIHPYSP